MKVKVEAIGEHGWYKIQTEYESGDILANGKVVPEGNKNFTEEIKVINIDMANQVIDMHNMRLQASEILLVEHDGDIETTSPLPRQ